MSNNQESWEQFSERTGINALVVAAGQQDGLPRDVIESNARIISRALYQRKDEQEAANA